MTSPDEESRLVLDNLRRIRDEVGGEGAHYSITTWELAEELERDHALPAPVFAHVMRGLVSSGDVTGTPMLNTPTNWHVTAVR